MDKRHIRRLKVVQQLYAITYSGTLTENELSDRTKLVLEHTSTFDGMIQDIAKKYSVDKIAKVDVSILRLALYELLIEKKVPPKVIINEAVELAKELGSEKSSSFVNAVLGKVYESIESNEQKND